MARLIVVIFTLCLFGGGLWIFMDAHPVTIPIIVFGVIVVVGAFAITVRIERHDQRMEQMLQHHMTDQRPVPTWMPAERLPAPVPANRSEALAWLDDMQAVSEPIAPAVVAPTPPAWTLGHVLFYGPPGTGKTTLAKVLAKELEVVYGQPVGFISVTPAQLPTKDTLDRLMDQISERDVLFIDEIHSLTTDIEEALYSVLSDREYHRSIAGLAISDPTPALTVVGATTLAGQLSKPLRDRFLLECELDPVTPDVLVQILQDQKHHRAPTDFASYHGQDRVKRLLSAHIHARDQKVEGLTQEAAQSIAVRSIGNPRIAKMLYQHAEAISVVRGKTDMDDEDVGAAVALLDIDERGLTRADHRIIRYLCERGNAPCGERALAVCSQVSVADLREWIEPRLLQLQILELTPRGRKLRETAYDRYRETR